ncbi:MULTISPECIES: helicase HerA-like domain-containing protein [Actinomyces]|uniref:ATPase n=1 Tax=Actinomyces oris TaxID=544580 RepID=A0A1Q8W279_9ACTO|nr:MULTISPECIES: helicase HerA-like domain-containing protein [Actinomyces]OFR51567.1 ATPase [Actinomyces sp. HMSC075C01]OLO54879.1 ATPase [Actinomyces oris]OLO55576.1 ATPase [Actinomyces oris]OLO62892.1 ATPase [Actinomyces oris]
MTDSAEIARLKAEAAQAAAEAAAAKAAAAQAALDAAIAATPASPVEQTDERPQETAQEQAPAQAEAAAATEQTSGSTEAEEAGYTAQVRSGYSFSSPTLPVGTYLDTLSGGEPAAVKGLSVGIPLGLLNRHALVAGATGTGKTRTLQLLAEGLSAAGVPVFLADVKGDLTGLAEAGASNDKIASRIASTGQDWKGQSFPIELFNLGGSDSGAGISGTPIRTTVTEFGPILLSRVLGLNDTQASALQLVFHWADSQGLALLDLKDLRAVVDYLTNTEAGKEELKTIGGVSAATAGVILREIAALEAAGGEAFFGEPALDVRDLMRVSPDGRGVISALELADIQSQGTLFSTFLMWLLAELFETLPEVGDPDKPTMVFFFDEAHLLFSGASKAFLEAVVRTVRLIRSKGVGIVFITQSPTDVPDEVLAQLGSRVQHALRAHTPADAANLKKAVSTFPVSPVDLSRVLTSLGTGQAVVSVLDEKGRPAPVAPVVINVPAAVMGPAQGGTVNQVLASSPLKPKYATSVDNESAYELLAQRVQADAEAAEAARAAEQAAKEAEQAAKEQAKADAAAQKALEKEAARQAAQRQKEAERLEREAVKEAQRRQREAEKAAERRQREVEKTIGSVGRQITREITRSIFGTLRRR